MLNQPLKYQNQKLLFTPAMKRARKPFVLRNAITGMVLLGFCGAVCILRLKNFFYKNKSKF